VIMFMLAWMGVWRRISQPSSSNKMNKVKDQPKSVKSRKNKKIRVNKAKCNDDVMESMSNANSTSMSNASVKNYMNDVKSGCLCAVCGYKWKPIGRTFTIISNSCPLTWITSTKVVPHKQTPSYSVEIPKLEIKVYIKKPKNAKTIGSSKLAKIIESKNANHSEPNNTIGSDATDIPSSSSLVMTVRFGNDQITRIMGYGDYQLGNVIILRLAKNGLARGIPRLKFQKDHLCPACALGKSKKASHQPKAEDTNQEKLYLLHMDLYGLMRVASINRKKKSRIKRYIYTKPNRELIHFCLTNPPYELSWKEKFVLDSKGNPTTATQQVFETYQNVKQEIRDQLNAEAEVVQIILTGIENDIYSTVDACPNACEMWKVIERLKQGESINVQDFETNLFWEFGKFTSLDGESLESYYSRKIVKVSHFTKQIGWNWTKRVITNEVRDIFRLALYDRTLNDEAKIDKMHKRAVNWVLQREFTVKDLLDDDINNNDVLRIKKTRPPHSKLFSSIIKINDARERL
nr:ribonuclease H-like domain-containing protein [Tanacetum cinerariifolium]